MNSIRWNLIPKKYFIMCAGGVFLILLSGLTGLDPVLTTLSVLGLIAMILGVARIYQNAIDKEQYWWHSFILGIFRNDNAAPMLSTDVMPTMLTAYTAQFGSVEDQESLATQLEIHFKHLLAMKYLKILEGSQPGRQFVKLTPQGEAYLDTISRRA